MSAVLNLKFSFQLMIYVTPRSNKLWDLLSYLSSKCDIGIGIVSSESLEKVWNFNKGLVKSFSLDCELVEQTFQLALGQWGVQTEEALSELFDREGGVTQTFLQSVKNIISCHLISLDVFSQKLDWVYS